MEKYLIIFSSMTFAIKARDLLKLNGIKASIVRTPSSLRKSCSYSISVSKGNFVRAANLVKSNQIRVSGFYPDDIL